MDPIPTPRDNTLPTRPVRVLIADDHYIMRRGMRTVVELLDGWSVCGEASNGLQAIDLATRLRPEVIVMDIDMPELDGVEATRRIKELFPETEVLIYTGLETEELIRDVFDSGARSYIMKTDGKDQLEAALRSVSADNPSGQGGFANAPRNIRFSGNLFDPGTEGVSNIDLSPLAE